MNNTFKFKPQVQAAAQKLLDHYTDDMSNNEFNDVTDIMKTGMANGDISQSQAKTLGALTKKYPNQGNFVAHGWWNNSDND